MNTHPARSSHFGLVRFVWLLIAAAGLLGGNAVRAAGPAGGGPVYISYSPDNLQSVQGDAPFHYGYELSVTSPSSFPANTTKVITMNRTVNNAPDGADPLVAAGYLTFSVPTLTFTGPNQVQKVQVSVDIPFGSASGDFTFWITTSGWPTGYNINDLGTYINMHVNPQGGFEAPGVEITTPADGTEYTYTVGGPAVQVPIGIHSSATESAPLLSVLATIRGISAEGTAITEVPLAIITTGLGSSSTESLLTLPVTVAGEYTITATAVNFVGESVTTSTFIVNEVVPPPVVTINPPKNNPSYTYISGITSVSVPYTFVATSYKGGIQTLTATLDGVPFNIGRVQGLGQLVATGTGSFVFNSNVPNAQGQHTISVTATDPYGNATTAATFVVNVVFPQISTTINNPVNGTTLYLPPDASPLNVPYDFTSTATNSATVTAVSATLTDSDGNTTPLSLSSTSGLGTATAKGAGTLPNVQPGTYTIGALGTNTALGLSAYASTTFTVAPPPPPVTTIPTPPQPTYNALAGSTLSIPFTGVTTSTGAYITTQVATLDGQTVTLTTDANGTALTATGTGTLSVSNSATPGSYTHTLVVTGTDTYGQTSTAQTTFTVVVAQPVITIAINPEIAAQSPYTLPSSGTLTIPFKFTGNITAGATVDTITGSLGSTAVTITGTTGLGTSSTATASGNLVITAAGTYTVTATDTNTASGVTATTSVTFTVKKASGTPPALTIYFTQTPQPTYYYGGGKCSTDNNTGGSDCSSGSSGGWWSWFSGWCWGGGSTSNSTSCSSNNDDDGDCNAPLSIPFAFTSKSSGGIVKTISATLDGKTVTLSSTSGLNTSTANGSGTLSVSTIGTHTLVALATDNYGQTVTTSTTFTVTNSCPAISVAINTPDDGGTYYLSGSSSGSCGGSYSTLKIPFKFTSTITTGATIDALSASLNGSSVSVSSSGLGTSTAVGTGTLSVSKVGKYTLTVKGIDKTTSASATASITFTVQAPQQPTVKITAPTVSSYTTYSGCGAISIPYKFVATSPSGTFTKLTATLDGQTLNVTASGLGTLNATGSGTMSVSGAGCHVIAVRALTANGSASDSFTFNVTVLKPTPTISISQPTDGAVFTYNEGDDVPAIPFSVSAGTSAGATISSLRASVGCDQVTVTTNGIGTAQASGTGSIKVSGPGTYTLTATATSGSATVTDKVSFTVNRLPKKQDCSIVWQSSACQGRSQKGGKAMPIKFQIRCKDGNDDDSVLNDPSVKICFYEVYRDGSSSSPRIYGCNDYSIDRNRQYRVDCPTGNGKHQYRVEIYRFPSGSYKPVLIGSKECSTD